VPRGRISSRGEGASDGRGGGIKNKARGGDGGDDSANAGTGSHGRRWSCGHASGGAQSPEQLGSTTPPAGRATMLGRAPMVQPPEAERSVCSRVLLGSFSAAKMDCISAETVRVLAVRHETSERNMTTFSVREQGEEPGDSQGLVPGKHSRSGN
jgi:hypothetical protein